MLSFIKNSASDLGILISILNYSENEKHESRFETIDC